MSKAKLLIQLPLLMLGACMPIQPQPQPNINVYVISDGAADDVGGQKPPHRPRVQTQVARTEQTANAKESVTCRRIHDGSYKLPPVPDLRSVPEGDDEKLIQLLLDHVEALRNELQEATLKCTSNG